MEDTAEDLKIARQKYIQRGKQGSKAPFRRAKADSDGGGGGVATPSSGTQAGSSPKLRVAKISAANEDYMKRMQAPDGTKLTFREALNRAAAEKISADSKTGTGLMAKEQDVRSAKANVHKQIKKKAEEEKRKKQEGGGSRDF
jgi:hypothetical protein